MGAVGKVDANGRVMGRVFHIIRQDGGGGGNDGGEGGGEGGGVGGRCWRGWL